MIEEERRDNALKCVAVAQRLWDAGNRDKSLIFLHKSLSIYPTKEATELRERYIRERAEGGTTQARGFSTQTQGPGPTGPPARREENPMAAASYTPEQQEMSLKIKELKNYYTILGVSKDASADEIKRAFRKVRVVGVSTPRCCHHAHCWYRSRYLHLTPALFSAAAGHQASPG